MTKLTWAGFFTRLLFAILVVFLSYNPEGYSYFHWGIKNFLPVSPVKAIAGLVLLIGWVIFIRATMRSLGVIGMSLVIATCAAILWLVIDAGFLPQDSIRFFTYAALVIVSLLLAIGMSWSHIRRRLSGQLDTDDVDG